MIAGLLGISLVIQSDAPTASSLLTSMFARYHSAKSLVGTISLTQSIGNESGRIDTSLQYERPAKLYIRQQMRTASGTQWIVTSDGKHFSYDKPRDTNSISVVPGGRLVESLTNKVGKLDLGGVYAATTRSLGDRSTPLDIAIARKEDLAFIKMQWATIKVTEKETVAGIDAWRIEGNWREYGEATVSGRFAMLVTANGDLKRFSIAEAMLVNGQQLTASSRWDVDLIVDKAPNPELFKVVL